MTSVIPSGRCFWRAFGKVGFLDELNMTEREIEAQPVNFVKLVINQGIKKYPDEVGLPIKILRITKSSIEWVE